MPKTSEKMTVKSLDEADEIREFKNGKLELVTIAGRTVGRGVFQPGWKWSNDVKPLAKTKSCEAPHFQYQISGRLQIVMDDGSKFVTKPGDVTNIPSGHDAWVIGDEPAVVVDFQGFVDYAKKK
jgi:hypothetical protein